MLSQIMYMVYTEKVFNHILNGEGATFSPGLY
jgi:hypothetical protein